MKLPSRLYLLYLFICIVLSACSATQPCLVSEPDWVIPPEDSAVHGSASHGYYYVNGDSSIWASAWWFGHEENYLLPGEGIKAGWFRPEGAELEITGQRLDGEAPALEANVPCCYPTRFQATGLYFPTEGCWEVTAKAENSILSFIVRVEP
jgi:hypothetical protein